VCTSHAPQGHACLSSPWRKSANDLSSVSGPLNEVLAANSFDSLVDGLGAFQGERGQGLDEEKTSPQVAGLGSLYSERRGLLPSGGLPGRMGSVWAQRTHERYVSTDGHVNRSRGSVRGAECRGHSDIAATVLRGPALGPGEATTRDLDGWLKLFGDASGCGWGAEARREKVVGRKD
jgi:hypothetical protein